MGIHRRVEVKDGYVIKTARNRISRYCNQVEWELSGTNRYFAKCLMVFPDFRELRMERVEIPGMMTRMRYARFMRMELKGAGVSDIRWYNVGKMHGHPVLYDYGGNFVLLRLLARKARDAIAGRRAVRSRRIVVR